MFFHSTHRHLHFLLPFSNSPAHSSTTDDFAIPILSSNNQIYSLILSPYALILIYTIQLLYHLSHQPTHMSYHVTYLPLMLYLFMRFLLAHGILLYYLLSSISSIFQRLYPLSHHQTLLSYHVTPAYSTTHHLVLPEGSYTKTRVAYFDVNWNCTFRTKWLSKMRFVNWTKQNETYTTRIVYIPVK